MRRGPSLLARSLAAKFAVVSLNTSQGTASPQSLSEPCRRQRLRSFPTPPPSLPGLRAAWLSEAAARAPGAQRFSRHSGNRPGNRGRNPHSVPCGRAGDRGVREGERCCACAKEPPAAILQRQAGGEAPRQLRRGARGSRRGGRAAQGYELKCRRRHPAEFGLFLPGAPPPSSRPSYRQPPLLGHPHPRQPCLSQGRPRHAVRAAAAQGEQPLQADPGEPPAPLLSPPPAAASPSSSLRLAGLARCPPGHFARRRSWPRLSAHGRGGRARRGEPRCRRLLAPVRPRFLPSFVWGPPSRPGEPPLLRVAGVAPGRGRAGRREGARQLPGPPSAFLPPAAGNAGQPGLRRRPRSPPRAAQKKTSNHGASVAGFAVAWLIPVCTSFPARASVSV